MSDLNSFSTQSKHNILPLIAVALLVLFLFALLSGKRNDDVEADFFFSGGKQNGTYANNNWFAVEVYEVNRDIAREYNISPKTKGVVIVDLDGSRDIFMKMREGDVITGINNKKIVNLKDFRKALQYVNPTEGMFLDIQRNGYPMYISLNGSSLASGRRPVDFQNPHPFTMTEVAPFLGRDINAGGINVESGIVGKQVEKWIESNFGSSLYACPKCGTLVPDNVYSKNKRISCPNCGTHMVSKK